ncbi:hypothetical protein FOL47_003150 [Perkinsus chesapeaki]|uniref:B box-type domain-containing protein n=1 Tax=Perkinsus chesapeaki TaxID=330153 RepID=A0A7J6M9F5_PERCH|nr:hypothetical protein FOL47_003150 [Perkinsus chesapeaki]
MVSCAQVSCRRCGSVTDVDSDTAEQLRNHFSQPGTHMTSVSGPGDLSAFNPRSFTMNVPPSISAISPEANRRRASGGPVVHRASVTPSAPEASVAVAPCGQCGRDVASIQCSNCDEEFCEKCASLIHRRGRMVDHRLSPINPTTHLPASSLNSSHRALPSQMSTQLPVSVKMIRTCPVHESEHVQYFCLACESPPMCSECVMRSEEHTKHLNQVFLLKKAFPTARTRIGELQRTLTDRLGDIRQSEEVVEQNRRDLVALRQKIKETISSSFASLRASLDRKEQELLSKAESEIRGETQRVESVFRDLQSKRERVEEVATRMEESLLVNDEVATLGAYAEIKQQMNSLATQQDSVKLSALRIDAAGAESFEKKLGEARRHIENMRGLKLTSSRETRNAQLLGTNESISQSPPDDYSPRRTKTQPNRPEAAEVPLEQPSRGITQRLENEYTAVSACSLHFSGETQSPGSTASREWACSVVIPVELGDVLVAPSNKRESVWYDVILAADDLDVEEA